MSFILRTVCGGLYMCVCVYRHTLRYLTFIHHYDLESDATSMYTDYQAMLFFIHILHISRLPPIYEIHWNITRYTCLYCLGFA